MRSAQQRDRRHERRWRRTFMARMMSFSRSPGKPVSYR